MTDLPDTNLVMLTLVKPEGELEVFLERRPMPEPAAHAKGPRPAHPAQFACRPARAR